ncbi:MAG TPA: hypothetical protein VLM37_12165, partial [Fibrobacteraceae bacterium]|nr:hypothetical protein [Fibrobacteraceae bacterium]
MKKSAISIISVLVFLFVSGLSGCAKKPPAETAPPPPPEEPATQPAPEPPPPPVDDGAAERERLEKQRLALENLLNQISGEEVLFAYDEAALTPQGKDILTRIGEILVKEPKLMVLIEGHTDERGTE